MSWRSVREARAKLEKEKGTVFKDWGGRIPVALVYPNSYYLGMSNLGLQTIYGLLNSYNGVVCERAFWEPRRARQGEGTISLESQRPLADFAVLAFSISYELDYFNVVQALRSSGIPLLAADRERHHPLVIGGGPCITANPEPLAPFFDLFAIGEGEVILPSLLPVVSEGLGGERGGLLKALAKVPGVYVPLLADGRVERQWVRQLDEWSCASVVLTPDTEFGDMYLMEASRGCGWGCRFCLVGFSFRPPRFRSMDALLRRAEVGLRERGRVGLVGSAVSDHPDLEELVMGLRRMGAGVGVSSLRVRPLSDVVLRALVESGTVTVTLAPEVGSEAVCQTINKRLVEEDTLRAVEKAAAFGAKQVKLYFMVGLPGEKDEDVAGIVRLALAARGIADRHGPGMQLTLNVAPFVPKASTPFQWLGMAERGVLERCLRQVKGGLAGRGVEIREESVGWSMVQGALSRGGRELGLVLAQLTENSLSSWRQAMRATGHGVEGYACRQLSVGDELPWSRLVSGVGEAYLAEELERARRGLSSPPCPPRDCHLCGVC